MIGILMMNHENDDNQWKFYLKVLKVVKVFQQLDEPQSDRQLLIKIMINIK